MCLDVGETLIDETRIWSTWADVLEVPRLTFMAALGAVIAGGGDHREVFAHVDRPDWVDHGGEVERRYGGFAEGDLYPDARRCLTWLRAAGYRIALVANQPASRGDELAALGLEADVTGMSDTLGVHKPDPAFFALVLELIGHPDAIDVLYVGDRIDNDVRPALAAGMGAVWLRRGPWALLQPSKPPPRATRVDSLDELCSVVDSVWLRA